MQEGLLMPPVVPAVPGHVNRVFQTQQTGSVAQVEVGSLAGGSPRDFQAVPRPKGLARRLEESR